MRLSKQGDRPVADPDKFYVEGIKGRLEEGEEERVLQLGLDTGKLLSAK